MLFLKVRYYTGEGGTEKEFLAQCIHNNSSYKTGPFVTINCSGMSEQMQMDRIFGNPASEDIGIQKGGLAVEILEQYLSQRLKSYSCVSVQTVSRHTV